MKFLSKNKIVIVEVSETKDTLFVSDVKGSNFLYAINLPEGRSLRERMSRLDGAHLFKEFAVHGYIADEALPFVKEVLSCKKEILNSDLLHAIAPVVRETIRSGADLGHSVFVYKGVVVEGGEDSHLHNLMVGLQNLFGYVDTTGMWSHRSMVKYVERESSIPYWHRYAVRALIAYSKSVPSLYIYGINDLTLDECRAVYDIIREVMWQEDERKARIRALEEAKTRRSKLEKVG